MVWVVLSVDEATVVAVTASAERGKAEAEDDCGKPLTWIERRDGRFTSTSWDYAVAPFEVQH
jgi:hypothetical protein